MKSLLFTVSPLQDAPPDSARGLVWKNGANLIAASSTGRQHPKAIKKMWSQARGRPRSCSAGYYYFDGGLKDMESIFKLSSGVSPCFLE